MNVIYKLFKDNETFDLTFLINAMGDTTEPTHIDTVPNLCDPVAVSLMYNMLVEGYDFKSKIPMSEKLYHHLTKDFIPHMLSMNPGKVKPIKLDVPILESPIERKANWVGTGASCGIDSFSVIKEYSENVSKDYQLTHLLYFKIGAHHGLKTRYPEDLENKIFREELEVANRFCKENGYKLVVVDSNVNQVANKYFAALHFENVALFRNAGVMLVMQEYFSKYVIATTYATFTDFSMDISDALEHNLWWSMPLLGSDNLEVVPAGSSMDRVDKTIYLSDFKPAFDNLMVCWRGRDNCGECEKCVRTLVALDFIGALDNFRNSFDIDKYKKDKKRHLYQVVGYSSRDPFFRELCDYAKENGIKLPNKFSSVVNFYWRIIKQTRPKEVFRLAVRRLRLIMSH